MAALLAALILAAGFARAYTYKVVADKSCEGVTLSMLELMTVPATCKPLRLVKPSSIALLHAGWEVSRAGRAACMAAGHSALGSIDTEYTDATTWRTKNAGRTEGDKDTTYLATCAPPRPGAPRRLKLRGFPGTLTLEQLKTRSRTGDRRSESSR